MALPSDVHSEGDFSIADNLSITNCSQKWNTQESPAETAMSGAVKHTSVRTDAYTCRHTCTH